VVGGIIRSCTFLLGNNIRFEDVLGRTRSLPYEHFRHWEVGSKGQYFCDPVKMKSMSDVLRILLITTGALIGI
jgi:hypothetical protein